MAKIKENPTIEKVKSAVIRKAFSWQSFPQGNDSLEKSNRMELPSHIWNTMGMRMLRYDVSSVAGFNREG